MTKKKQKKSNVNKKKTKNKKKNKKKKTYVGLIAEKVVEEVLVVKLVYEPSFPSYTNFPSFSICGYKI